MLESVRRRLGPATEADVTDTQQWRASLLSTILRFVLVLGAITAVPSIAFALSEGRVAIAVIDAVALAWVVLITLRRGLPFLLRSMSFLLLVYLVGVSFLFSIGLVSQIYLMAVPVLTALLLGLRPALVALAVNFVTMLVAGAAVGVTLGPSDAEHVEFGAWTIITLNFIFVNAVITISSAVLLGRLERSLMRQQTITTSLEEGQASLRAANEELAREVAVRKQAEEQSMRLAMAVEQAREIILISDTDGQIVYANRAYDELTGPRGVPPVRRLQELRTTDGHGESLDAVLGEQRQWDGGVVMRAAGGEALEFEALLSPLRDAAGNAMNIVAVLRDVTLERQMETRLRRSEKLEALGTLVGGTAHDFNNVIGSILAVAEFMRDDVRDSPLEGNVEHIITACHRARDIVRQIMAFGRQSTLDRRAIGLRATIEESLPLLRTALPRGIDLHVDLATEGTVVANRSEIHQLLMNLTTNAADAMRDDAGGALTITLTSVTPDEQLAETHPRLRAGARYLYLTVSDTGQGIDRVHLDRIFDPFFTTKPEGTGLGLATVHGVVTSLDGEINIYTEPGTGTTFRIYLPDARVPADEPAIDDREPGLGVARILLVDDEATLLSLSERSLSRLGYAVTVAKDGREARQLFDDDPSAFDVVVTDLSMPGLSGADLIRHVHAARPELPAILSSGFGESIRADELDSLHLSSYLQKPYTLKDLTSQVEAALIGA